MRITESDHDDIKRMARDYARHATLDSEWTPKIGDAFAETYMLVLLPDIHPHTGEEMPHTGVTQWENLPDFPLVWNEHFLRYMDDCPYCLAPFLDHAEGEPSPCGGAVAYGAECLSCGHRTVAISC